MPNCGTVFFVEFVIYIVLLFCPGTAYVVCGAILFVLLPLSPMMLDVLLPLNVSRPKQYILNGEFLVDREAYYAQIYAYDFLASLAIGFIIVVCDSMYAVCVEHCLGLFAIVRFDMPLERSAGLKHFFFFLASIAQYASSGTGAFF